MKKSISLFLFLLAALSLFSQKAIIPFVINHNGLIVLEYPVKNIKLHFVYDTGMTFNILDKTISKELDFACVNNDKSYTLYSINGVPIDIMLYDGVRPMKQDTVFWGSWLLSDMKVTSARLNLGENIDGIVGYCSDDIVEFNFPQQELKVWKKLPDDYTDKMVRVDLVDSDSGYRAAYRIGPYKTCLKSQLTVLDSLNLKPNLLLDTGNPLYISMAVYDSLLYKSLIDYKQHTVKTRGDNFPTTKLSVPGLNIDTAFTKLQVFPKCYENKDGFNPFNYKIGGLLGVKFLQMYRRVIIDRRRQLAYFEKYIN